MRKFVSMVAMTAAAMVFGATSAYANVTCTAMAGCGTSNASFIVTPNGVGPGYKGDISAGIVSSNIAHGSFTDTFSFTLPYNGLGSGLLSSTGTFKASSVLVDFTSILLNGVALATTITQGNGTPGSYSTVTVDKGVMVNAGPNIITVNGTALGAGTGSKGTGSYSGSISFTTAVPELATWGMMILGFAAMGGVMRHRRRSTQVSFA